MNYQIIEQHVPTDAWFNIHIFTSNAEEKHRKGLRGQAVDTMESVQRLIRENNLQKLYSVQFMPPRLKLKPAVREGTVHEEQASGEFTKVTWYHNRPRRVAN